MTLFDKAARFALEAHAGQRRKRSDIPAVLHAMEVAAICATLTSDEEVLAAALLHDTVEDTSVTIDDISREFGPRVTALVAAETEDKRPGQPPAQTWRVRKEESLAELAAADDDGVAMVWLGDKLSNMRSFVILHRREGDELWRNFNQPDESQQRWYYTSVADLIEPALGTTDAWREYATLLAEVFPKGGDRDVAV